MIIFLRHGQAENNVKRILAGRTDGVHLTKTGIEQAENDNIPKTRTGRK